MTVASVQTQRRVHVGARLLWDSVRSHQSSHQSRPSPFHAAHSTAAQFHCGARRTAALCACGPLMRPRYCSGDRQQAAPSCGLRHPKASTRSAAGIPATAALAGLTQISKSSARQSRGIQATLGRLLLAIKAFQMHSHAFGAIQTMRGSEAGLISSQTSSCAHLASHGSKYRPCGRTNQRLSGSGTKMRMQCPLHSSSLIIQSTRPKARRDTQNDQMHSRARARGTIYHRACHGHDDFIAWIRISTTHLVERVDRANPGACQAQSRFLARS